MNRRKYAVISKDPSKFVLSYGGSCAAYIGSIACYITPISINSLGVGTYIHAYWLTGQRKPSAHQPKAIVHLV